MTADGQPVLTFDRTGNEPLDRILGGGIPKNSVVVVAGEPGAGKTVLTLQMLFHAARQGRKCLYFTTVSEPAVKLIRYMQLFDFFDIGLMDKSLVFADLGASIREGPEKTLADIEARVEKLEPAFVAIDSFRAIVDQFRGLPSMRSFVYDLAVRMAGWSVTTLLVGEYVRDDVSIFAEFAVADGIIRLGAEHEELTSVRELEILKLRGAAYASGKHFFDIGLGGVSVYPRVGAPSDTQSQPSPAAASRIATGVSGLDDLLDGGIPEGSATLVEGPTGTGKTILGLQFLLTGISRGEKGVLFTLEETPAQLRSIARSLGWDLAALEADDRLAIKYTSPVELSTDRFLHDAMNTARELEARRAVFDSLTTISLGVPSERRFKEMVYSLAKHMRGEGVSVLMNLESDQLLGAPQLTGHGVSFIADVLILLRYVEMGGRLERALSVLKARGVRHNSELRSVTIGKNGLKVTRGRFKDMRGVLTGIPARSAKGS